MTSKIITIVAAIVDKTSLTLYKEDGTTFVIKQGDPRVRKIVDEVMPQLIMHGKADVDIATEDDINHYAEFEKQTNGFVKFFRVAKEKVEKLFSSKPKEETAQPVPDEQMMAAVNEIMASAIPVSSEHFTEEGLDNQTAIVTDDDGTTSGKHDEPISSETIIAVANGKMIPGVEKIKNQFVRANMMGSPKGVKRFLERLGKVKRNHSVEDLLKFMERADLPIADDGSIIIYKVLGTKGDVLIDLHSSKIEQWPGAVVSMAEDMVDHNRNNECSNGLHVARRGYIGSFNGDVCTMCKLAPEDVIAVPEYDANKMRVCGYHILSILPPELFELLKKNRPITENELGAKLLANVLKGNHIGQTHRIEIINNRTKETKVTVLDAMPIIHIKEVSADLVVQNVAPVVALADNPTEIDMPVDPTEVNKAFVKISRRDEGIKLMGAYHKNPTEENYQALLALKRSAKVSWSKLGLEEPLTPEAMLAKQKKVARKPPVSAAMLPTATNRDRVQSMLPVSSKEDAEAILTIKRQCRKSWAVLGVSDAEQAVIRTLIQDK